MVLSTEISPSNPHNLSSDLHTAGRPLAMTLPISRMPFVVMMLRSHALLPHITRPGTPSPRTACNTLHEASDLTDRPGADLLPPRVGSPQAASGGDGSGPP